MMTSPRPHGDVGASFASRRGRSSQISISDSTHHHVTEAIGTLYGDEDEYHGGPPSPITGTDRPLSFVGGGPELLLHTKEDPRRHLIRSSSDNTALLSLTSPLQPALPLSPTQTLRKSQTLPLKTLSQRTNANSYDQNGKAALSPAFSLRDMDADSQFSLTDMRGPSDIAQELSNLQALRRLSMDVGNSIDPDLPPFSGMSVVAMPSLAPSGSDDENDPSRLLWVPARVHPELAPSEFKSFLEKRVNSINRRSGDSFLSVDGALDRGAGSLRRKKSMLSRQIDTFGENDSDDMPILPVAPIGMGLRRSTRTTYRKGGSIRGERLPFAKRLAQKQQEHAGDSSAEESVPQSPEAPKGHGLVRVQSEPAGDAFSRPPARSVRRQQKFELSPPLSEANFNVDAEEPPMRGATDTLPPRPSSSSESQSRLPQIVEAAPHAEQPEQQEPPNRLFPQRSSSQKTAQHMQQPPPIEEPPARSSKRPQPAKSEQSALAHSQQAHIIHAHHQQQPQAQTVSDMAANPSILPGGGASRTDSLTFIPTAPPEDKSKKNKKDEDAASVTSSKSTSSWRWFKGSSEEKERKRREEESKKARSKAGLAEKPQDNVRLDVLQTFDSSNAQNAKPKGRESFILDRDSLDSRLQEERKKEGGRRNDSKKEKDGIFSSLFGSGKKKVEKETGSSKKKELLRVIEEAPYRPLRPDVDYPWTRFPLLEERAIYRMAHIKLANPRRSLHSQVLLSNFMYSYLAIVQAMHPLMNVPTSPQQRRIEEEARKNEREHQKVLQREREPQLAMQQHHHQFQEEPDQYDYEYHRHGTDQYRHAENGEYDDGQIYEEHGEHHHSGYGYDGHGGHYDDHQQNDYQDSDHAHRHSHAHTQHDARDGRW